jgi:lysophospholipase L1-like esterase
MTAMIEPAWRLVSLALRVTTWAIVLAGGAEVGTRILAHHQGTCHPQCFTRYDASIGWAAVPGAVARHRNDALGFDVVYRINHEGFRGPLYGRIKPRGITRAVLLGDSNGFGFGVADGKEFGSLLDQRVEDTEVINLSLTGYSTDQQLLTLRKGLAFDPDIVLLQVTPNDLRDVARAFVGDMPKPFVRKAGRGLRFENVPVRLLEPDAARLPGYPIPLMLREFLLLRSFLCRGLAQGSALGSRPQAGSYPGDDPVELFQRVVAEIGAVADDRGASLIVVHASSDLARNEVFSGLDATVVDVSGAFEEAQRSGVAPLFADGLHWNEQGHRLVAETLADVVSSIRRQAPRRRRTAGASSQGLAASRRVRGVERQHHSGK